MATNDAIAAKAPEIVALRQEIHANPELGFVERKTADRIAARLAAAGLEVHRDLTETAVVGVLKRGSSSRRVMFRAELDALPIEEQSGVPYASRNKGVMHACGHDGHIAMLAGAAELLARSASFDGTIIFVFQPAEEVHGGARRLIEADLLRRFPASAAYAMHNWPGLAEGLVVSEPGPRMAAVDDFTLTFSGNGAHAAMPHLGDDPILAASELVGTAQRIVARSVDPQTALVLSFTQIHGGTINNVVPREVRLEGTARFLDGSLSDHVEQQLTAMAAGIARGHGLTVTLDYRRGYPAVINPAGGAEIARRAALAATGARTLPIAPPPSMGCEDFAFLLNAVGDGAYVWLGAGDVRPGAGLHGDRYDFNDRLIPLGLRFWTELAATALPVGG